MDPELKASLRDFGIADVKIGTVLAKESRELARGWRVALDRASKVRDTILKDTEAWIRERLTTLAHQPISIEQTSLAAEVESALRLSWVDQVVRVQECAKKRTADFRVRDLNIEVYCPQKHQTECQVVDADLKQQRERSSGSIRVALAIGRPWTGSGRTLDEGGCIRRDPNSQALDYPTNKLIDRLLNQKREGMQFPEAERNILWLDLKHGLGMHTRDCIPFRSEISKETCFMGISGVWHAFYAHSGAPHFPERTTLEWFARMETYPQQKDGWFRQLTKVSAAVLSTLDGVLLFENPWADLPLDTDTRERFARLSEFRPEASWFGVSGPLQRDVESMLQKISWIAQIISLPANH